jgi:hypothetical protein
VCLLINQQSFIICPYPHMLYSCTSLVRVLHYNINRCVCLLINQQSFIICTSLLGVLHYNIIHALSSALPPAPTIIFLLLLVSAALARSVSHHRPRTAYCHVFHFTSPTHSARPRLCVKSTLARPTASSSLTSIVALPCSSSSSTASCP